MDEHPSNPSQSVSPISVALSGGGHRAALFGLGALLYLVDSGANTRVDSIISVSGGSFTNGVVGQRCDFSHVTGKEFDDIAAHILDTISRRGVLFRNPLTWMYLSALGFLALMLAVDMIFRWPFALSWYGYLLGLMLLFALAISRGRWTEFLLAQSYLRGHHVRRFRDVTSSINHVFCATDLNAGAPFYLETKPATVLSAVMGRAGAGDLRLEEALRASAAFPGALPPKRLSLRRFRFEFPWQDRQWGVIPTTDKLRRTGDRRYMRRRERVFGALKRLPPRALFLTDGGVWNNLATEWVLSGVNASMYRLQPTINTPRHILVVDSSAPVTTKALHGLHIPGLAEIGAIGRFISLLYANTVDPRVDALGALTSQAAKVLVTDEEVAVPGAWIGARERVSSTNGWIMPVVVRIGEPAHQVVRRANRDLARAGLAAPYLTDQSKELQRENWEGLKSLPIYGKPVHTIDYYTARVPTTLARLSQADATRLVIHGYHNTMLAGHVYLGLPLTRFPPLHRFSRLLAVGSERSVNRL